MMRIPIIETNLSFGELAEREATTGIVIHHTGETDLDLSAAQIHEIHLGNGWAGIGYHKVFRKDGTVERGRPEWARGAHAPGVNGTTLGYHICGSFGDQTPNEAQLAAVAAAAADDCERYGFDPLSGITGHRDHTATECPGDALYAMLPEIARRVAELLAGG